MKQTYLKLPLLRYNPIESSWFSYVPSVKKTVFSMTQRQQPPAASNRRRGFDNDFFGIDIEEAQAISPSQRWVMEVGYEARRFGLLLGSACLFFWGKFMAKVFFGGNSWLFCWLERLEVKWWWWDGCWDAGNLINDSSFWDGKSWKSWNLRWRKGWSDFGRKCGVKLVGDVPKFETDYIMTFFGVPTFLSKAVHIE